MKQEVKDTLGRVLRDLRISVTDRCNFRCTYCMPKEIFGGNYNFMPQEELLTFEEITRLTRIFVSLGTRKIRLTGGEPLVRRDIDTLITMLAEVPGADDTALTTNGSFPINRVQEMRAAGLNRITVSLDSLDEATFQAMNDVDFPVQKVLDWIDACVEAKYASVKVNMVVKRGINEDSILPMARYFNRPGVILRFIEYMDVGSSNGWRLDDVVSAKEIVKRIQADMPVEPVAPNYLGEVANRWRYKDTYQDFGVIASVTQPFCGDCTRARLSADGSIYTCLFAIQGHDLKTMLRQGAMDEEIKEKMIAIWQKRADRYSEIRSSLTDDLPKIEMSFIGG
ncbi:MAG: GTP 3',8-cyclase MoaA [Chloroflexota bacterium]